MSLKEMAQRILLKNETALGTASGTECPKGLAAAPSRGTDDTSMNTGVHTNCPNVTTPYTGTVGHPAESGTPGGTVSGTLAELDPFQESGAAIKMFFPDLDRDIWLCSNERSWELVKNDGLICLLFSDLNFILQGKPGKDRLNRLHRVCAKRHPVTEEVVKLFNGKITKMGELI